MASDLFGAAPPAREVSGAGADAPASPAAHVCSFCGNDVAPFGKGSPFRMDEIVWACRAHRGKLG